MLTLDKAIKMEKMEILPKENATDQGNNEVPTENNTELSQIKETVSQGLQDQSVENEGQASTSNPKTDAMKLLRSGTRRIIEAHEAAEAAISANNVRLEAVQKQIKLEKMRNEAAKASLEESKATREAQQLQMNHLSNQFRATGTILTTLKEFVNDLENRRKCLTIDEIKLKIIETKARADTVINDMKALPDLDKAASSSARIDPEYDTIERKNIELKRTYEEMQGKLNASKERGASLDAKHDLAKSNYDEAKKGHAKKLANLAETEKEVMELRSLQAQQHEERLKRIAELEAEKQLQQQKLAEMKQRNQEMMELNETKRIALENERQSIKELNCEKNKMESKLNGLKQKYETKCQEQVATINNLDEVKQIQVEKLDEIEIKATATTNKIDGVQQYTGALNEKLLTLNQLKSSLNVKMLELSNLIDKDEMKRDNLRKEAEIRSKHLEQLKLNHEEQVKVAEAEEKLNNSSLESSREALISKQSKYDNFVAESSSKLTDLTNKISYKKACIDYSIEKNNAMLEEKASASKELEMMTEESESIRSLISEKNKKIEGLLKELTERKKLKQEQTQKVERPKTPVEGILKSPGRPVTPTKKVTFVGVSSYESDSSAGLPEVQLPSFDQILKLLEKS